MRWGVHDGADFDVDGWRLQSWKFPKTNPSDVSSKKITYKHAEDDNDPLLSANRLSRRLRKKQTQRDPPQRRQTLRSKKSRNL